VVARGTLALVTDLHEISNVCGLEGINYILDAASHLPLEFFVMAPSCVPATHMETAGATIGAEELKQILKLHNVIGLGEMMNFPGVIFGDQGVMDKIKMAGDKVIDGHAPGLGGKDLTAYIAAGISSDHESVTYEEAREKLRQGMYLMIREGSSEKNLEALLPLVTDKTYKRCLFVVDDRSCADLLRDGDIDAVVRKAIALGLEPVRAVQLATINTSERFGLKRLGGIAPGYIANMIVVGDLQRFDVQMSFYHGRLVAEQGQPKFDLPEVKAKQPTDTVNIKPFTATDLKLKAKGVTMPVIEVVPGQIITRKAEEKVKVEGDIVVPDVPRDLLKIVVIERHKASGNIGIGLIKGFGLKKGALASSVAHDSHNVVAVGTNDDDVYAGVKEIERIGGGLAVVAEGKMLGSLALPVAGLLSREPLAMVVDKLEELKKLTAGLGAIPPAPFATLSFMALPVIPELRLTDLGLVDVNAFKLID
jgi:adenine deaminase